MYKLFKIIIFILLLFMILSLGNYFQFLDVFQFNKAQNKLEISIEDFELAPKNFNRLPSYFYLEVKNVGILKAEKVNISIDFGTATYGNIEVVPEANLSYFSNMKMDGKDWVVAHMSDVYKARNSNNIEIDYNNLSKDESIYIYAFLTQPHFEEISITAKNKEQKKFNKIYTYNDYIKKIF